jgi:hypothetical protein
LLVDARATDECLSIRRVESRIDVTRMRRWRPTENQKQMRQRRQIAAGPKRSLFRHGRIDPFIEHL